MDELLEKHYKMLSFLRFKKEFKSYDRVSQTNIIDMICEYIHLHDDKSEYDKKVIRYLQSETLYLDARFGEEIWERLAKYYYKSMLLEEYIVFILHTWK
jgi:hypothetical protein